jgi:hypothetical protein
VAVFGDRLVVLALSFFDPVRKSILLIQNGFFGATVRRSNGDPFNFIERNLPPRQTLVGAAARKGRHARFISDMS